MAHRIRRILLWIVAALIGIPVLLVLAVLLLANTRPGRQLIADETTQLTGGLVSIADIGGRFPDALRIGHLAIADTQGVWLSLDDVQLDWSPLALIGGTVSIQNLSATRLSLPRLPAPGKPAATSPGGGASQPVKIHLAKLDVARASIGAAVAGRAAILRLHGSADIASPDDVSAHVAIDRLDSAGTYRLTGRIDAQAIAARLTAAEPAGGFVGGLAGLPDIGALSLDAAIQGPRTAEATRIALAAGPLKLAAAGLTDLPAQTATLDITGNAPAMAPRPDLSWQSIALTAHIHGSFTEPEVAAHATLAGLATGGARIATLTANASGNQGAVDVHLVMEGIVLPQPNPDLLANGPLELKAHIALDQPSRPVAFKLTHRLLSADGTAQTGIPLAARIHVIVPDIAPLAALGRVDLQGTTEAVATLATQRDDTNIAIDGTTDFTGGQAPVPTLLGRTNFGVTARLNGQDFTITRAKLQGRALAAAVTGTDLNGKLDLAWTLGVTDLSAAAPPLIGAIQASGHLQGPQTSLAADADLAGDIGTANIAKGPIKLSLHAAGLPGSPTGTVEATGRFAGAPVTLLADVQRSADGALHALLRHAAWKSFGADADLNLAPGATLPAGRIAMRMTRLADLEPLLKQSIAGSVTGTVTSPAGRKLANIDLVATNLSLGGNAVARMTLAGQVADPGVKPDASLALAATGIAAGAITGDARLTLRGPPTALGIQADASLHHVAGADAHVSTRLTLDAAGHKLLLSRLDADSHNEHLHLVAPARLDVGAALGVDRLRLALGAATLDIAGKLAPALSLTVALRGVTPDLAKPFVPTLNAAGTLTADARLTGTMARPLGSLRIAAQGLRVRNGPGASLAPASAVVTATLQGDRASLSAHAAAGPKLSASLTGQAPLGAGTLALQAAAKLDLALLDPVLGATGQRAEGLLTLNGSIGGTTQAPALGGTLTLAGGEIQDFVQGFRIQNIGATVEASGESIRIAHLSGQAGGGTIAATGTLGLAAPGMPIDLHIAAARAKPLASDRLTTTLDASIDITGQALADMLVSGRIFLRRTDINIPDSFPPSVAKLDIIRPGQKPSPPSAAASSVVRLALSIDAPSGIFVRGHGLDAELGGKLTVGGTAATPNIGGGFDLRRGDFSLAGTTLQFSKGEVSFNGSGVSHAIDPTLDFEADSTAGGITATLAITGYADAPVIKLGSVPDLPQDEVLAHLLFGTSVSSLSPIQIAEIAAAVAELSGVGGGGGALGTVRSTLGLDRLNVSGGSGTTGATVEAGRYVARGVYVGAKQATGSGGTVAQVQIDLTRHLKATAQVGTGGGSVQGTTPDNDTGSTIGLAYRFEY